MTRAPHRRRHDGTARETLATIVERLRASGYRFIRPKTVLVAPPPDASTKLDEIEAEGSSASGICNPRLHAQRALR